MKKMSDDNKFVYIVLLVVFLFLLTIFGIIYYDFKARDKAQDMEACVNVGGTYRQCLKLAYPEEWAEDESRRNKMRELLKNN
jgi:hypothetical protein